MSFWEVSLNYDQSGELAQNVLHYSWPDNQPIDFQIAADIIGADYLNLAAVVIAPNVTFDSVTFRPDLVGSVGQTYFPAAAPVPGASADNQYAKVLSCLVRKQSTSLVRPVQGRIYQVGVTSEGLNGSGEFNATVRDALDLFWTDMLLIAAGGGDSLSMVIKASNPTAPNTQAYTNVTSVSAIRNPATQRRRNNS